MPKAVSSAARQRSRPGQTTAISSAEERQRLVGDELERPPQARAFEEAQRSVQRRRIAGLTEEGTFQVREHRPARGGARRQLLGRVGQRGQVLGGARERGEGIPAGLVRERDRHLGAAREGLEQRPLGAGQVLEAVRKDRPAVPGTELSGDPLGRVAAFELAVPEAAAVELLAVGGVELGQLPISD